MGKKKIPKLKNALKHTAVMFMQDVCEPRAARISVSKLYFSNYISNSNIKTFFYLGIQKIPKD